MQITAAVLVLLSGNALASALSPRQAAARDLTVDDILKRDACHANNCARAVTGTRQGTAVANSHRADCSSFFVYTVSDPVTSTVYVTPTVVSVFETTYVSRPVYTHSVATLTTEYEDYGNSKRGAVAPSTPPATRTTVKPTSVPSYASACGGSSAYSSACSCWGVSTFLYTDAYYVATTTITEPPYTQTIVDVIETPTSFVSTEYDYTIVERIPCGGQAQDSQKVATFNIHCDSAHAGAGTPYGVIPDVHDYQSCLDSCAAEYYCKGAEFDISAQKCTIYQSDLVESPTKPQPNNVFAFVASRRG